MCKSVFRKMRAIVAGMIIAGATLFAAPASCDVDGKSVIENQGRYLIEPRI